MFSQKRRPFNSLVLKLKKSSLKAVYYYGEGQSFQRVNIGLFARVQSGHDSKSNTAHDCAESDFLARCGECLSLGALDGECGC